MIERILATLSVVRTDLFVGALIMIVSFVASVVFVVVAVTRLPEDTFLTLRRPPQVGRSALVRWTLTILRNVAGAMLIAVGVVMSIPGVPGQGILTILIGLLLVDLPGKRKLARALVGRPRILRSLNSIRSRFGRPPFRVDDPT